MLEGETIACTGARLTGRHLSGRDEGGGVWTIDLGQVTGAVYSENNQLAHDERVSRVVRNRSGTIAQKS